jgi:hypothetical protein
VGDLTQPDNITSEYMRVELQARAVDLHLQEVEKNDDRVKEMEHEIERPRCTDMMILSSEFDRVSSSHITVGVSYIVRLPQLV